jgi:hypothetical protein
MVQELRAEQRQAHVRQMTLLSERDAARDQLERLQRQTSAELSSRDRRYCLTYT